jgi:hypothetical protein
MPLFLRLPPAAIGALGLAVVAAGCGSAGAADPPAQHFRSRPDIRPPRVTVLTPAHGTAPGYLFVSPERGVDQAGPLILRDDGQVVWFDPLDARRVTNFRVQRYRGRPVLTWWSTQTDQGGHNGLYVMADDSYRVIKTISPAHGLSGDLHEFLLTPRGTAILTAYHRVPYDLSGIGGSAHGAVWEGIVQEIDVASGRLLFEWHSLDHVAVGESYDSLPIDASKTYDYFHLNSVDREPNGNLLVSARNTHAVYEIRRSDGAVVWRLGGKRTDFTFGKGARFAWQHDVRLHAGGTLTMFDNEAVHDHRGIQSRVIVLRLDRARHTARLVRSYTHPRPLLSTSEGSAQLLSDRHVLVGWGSQRYITEFAPDGRVLLDLRLGSDRLRSYRSYRFRWTGHPLDRPALAAVRGTNATTVYASWNGATAVAAWRVLAGPDARRLSRVAQAAKTGFETALRVDSRASVFQVAALNDSGRVLRMSRPVSAR